MIIAMFLGLCSCVGIEEFQTLFLSEKIEETEDNEISTQVVDETEKEQILEKSSSSLIESTVSSPTQSTNHLISRSVLDGIVQNSATISKELRIFVHTEGEIVDGCRITGIRKDSPLDGLRIQNGDIVQEIHGMLIREPAQLQRALASLAHTTNFEIKLLRQQTPLFLRYDVE